MDVGQLPNKVFGQVHDQHQDNPQAMIGCSYIASNDYFTLTAIPCTDVLPRIKIILYVLFMFYIVYYY